MLCVTSHSHHMSLGNCFGDILIPLNPLITMATNEEMPVSAFQEKVAIRSSFNLADMFSYVSQLPD